jgi:sialate O-acetylesterase
VKAAAAAAFAALLLASGAEAAPTLHPLFSDHAVLQRDRPIRLWGKADPGERLTVTFGQGRAAAVAGADGVWRAELEAMAAGGPYRLEVTGANGARAGADDVLVGDVWLCSGQSNMELPLTRVLNNDSEIAGAKDPELRILTVPKKTAVSPAYGFGGPVAWTAVTPQSVPGFSAACYFMAKELRGSQHVPIGAINASWGGTAIRSWLDESASRLVGGADADLLATYRHDPIAANRQFGTRWQAWWEAHAHQAPWRDASGLTWKPMPKIAYWETWGDPAFAKFDGIVWARKRLTLTAEEAARAETLSLGVVDEIDETFVNGVPVGNTFGWDVDRDYRLPKGLLHAGENVILVNLLDAWGYGGFQGPAEKLRLGLAGGASKPLGEGWDYSVVPAGIGDPPRSPWDAAAGLSLIYDGMIAPLGAYGFKGAAWYQGETDAGSPAGYADKLQAMMAGWRRQFAAPGMPFLIVSLANYGGPQVGPHASGWAEIREAQRAATVRDGHAAIVVAMDLGDRLDIHPANKQEVGRRLAQGARALAYGAAVPPSGPEIVSARRRAAGIVLSFRGVKGALHAWSGARPLGFELCDLTQDSCRYAEATAEGASVRLADDGRPATRVRYAWADAPVVNLYDEAPLPAGPFEVPIGR